jgi:O-antigen/teichoic acid export membrane protein
VQVVLALWQIRMKPVPYGIFQVLQTSMNVLLAFVLIVPFHMSWQGRIIAQICCDSMFGIISIFILYKNKWLKFEYERSYIGSALKYGIPLIPHALAGWTMAAIDRVFINKMIGVADTGVYTIGYQVAMIIVLIETSFNNAWVPWFYHNLTTGDHMIKIKIVKITYAYVTLMLSLALFLSFSATWFMKFLVGREFYGSVQFIFWLALGKGIYSMYFMTCNYLFYMERTVLVAISTFSAAAIHIAVTYLLININGLLGSQAGIISNSV